MFESAQLEAPVGTPRARRLELRKITFTRQAGKCAAADPEGFAHSAAAGGAKSLDIKAKQAGQAEWAWQAGQRVVIYCCGSSLAHLASENLRISRDFR